jgi:hypothetical protein
MQQVMLTTSDNPYDPFDQYDDWYAYDQRKGYNTPGLLARIAVVSDELSEADQHVAIELAVDEIVRENVTGLYLKVTRDFEDKKVEVT